MTKLVKFGDNGIEVKIEKNINGSQDIWLDTQTIADLFGKDRTVITRHINNIYKENEVDKKTYKSFNVITEKNGRKYKKEKKEYNLDVILSVGYKVNGKKGNEFRKWANQILGQYLKKGYVVNERIMLSKGADEFIGLLNNAEAVLKQGQSGKINEFTEILNVIKDYSYSFKTLQDYDEDNLTLEGNEKGKLKYTLEYDSALKYIAELKRVLIKKGEATQLFGQEKTHQSLGGIIGNIFNCFSWGEPYPSLEEKASHLLYFVIKNHPFNDGNKRIGSFLFQSFIKLNKFDLRNNGEKKINDTTLVTVALMIAESNPKQKETMIKLVVNLLRKR